ncbi:hypothetical protein [Methylobacterium sp. WSM2598]|uniref:hypothetical protein n=1 Tax=Methylobacterium sp. WSM2598 TaxID=398261 RepID=UPI0003660377|nr:hypothetical protein [Methylobacterium sp. WSM2598]
MRVREKGKDEIVHMGWDEAQVALQAGTHEVAEGSEFEVEPESGRGDQSEDQGGHPPSDDGLDAKTKPELEALATERGVDISAAKTKADLLAALRAPR